MSYCEEVALLKQALTEADREHNLAIATAVQSHASQIQQYILVPFSSTITAHNARNRSVGMNLGSFRLVILVCWIM